MTALFRLVKGKDIFPRQVKSFLLTESKISDCCSKERSIRYRHTSMSLHIVQYVMNNLFGVRAKPLKKALRLSFPREH